MSQTEDVRELPFEPLPKQRQFMLSTADQVMLSGAFGSGKSRVGCEKGYYLNQKYPGNRGLIVRKSLKDVKASTVSQTLLDEVIPESHIADHIKQDSYIKHYTGTRDRNGDPVLSEIYYYGVEAGRGARDDDLPEKIGSTAFGWIFVDEGTELEQGEWNQLYGRLRYDGTKQAGQHFQVPLRQIFTATNPDSPNHWMYDHFRPDDPEAGKGEVYKMALHDNPYLPDDYVRNLEQNLSGMYYERYVEGEWVGAEGMVYDEFRPDKHILDDPEQLPHADEWQVHGRESYDNGDESVFVTPPPDWTIYRAIDFGYRNPFVCQWWAKAPRRADDPYSDCLVLFREIYQSETIVEDHASRIRSLTPDGRDVAETFADHDPEEVEVLRRNGVDSTAANKDIESGIQAVKSRLAPNSTGTPQLFFLAGARAHEPDQQLQLADRPLCTTDEIYSYEWQDDQAEEEPKAEDDHGMDAMRYLVHSLDGNPVMSEDEMESWAEMLNGGAF